MAARCSPTGSTGLSLQKQQDSWATCTGDIGQQQPSTSLLPPPRAAQRMHLAPRCGDERGSLSSAAEATAPGEPPVLSLEATPLLARTNSHPGHRPELGSPHAQGDAGIPDPPPQAQTQRGLHLAASCMEWGFQQPQLRRYWLQCVSIWQHLLPRGASTLLGSIFGSEKVSGTLRDPALSLSRWHPQPQGLAWPPGGGPSCRARQGQPMGAPRSFPPARA